MDNERENSVLIPYKVENEKVFVFLQKRNKNSKILADHFAFFGGKSNPGETPDQALEREIKEELEIDVKGYSFLGRYSSFANLSAVLNVYFCKVGNNFEKEIKVNEGDYGKFFSEEEVEKEPMLIVEDKKIIKDLCLKLKNGNN